MFLSSDSFHTFYCTNQGGFAKCYELKDLATGEVTAGKIVPKSLLTKSHQKEKMSQEIRCSCSCIHDLAFIIFHDFMIS